SLNTPRGAGHSFALVPGSRPFRRRIGLETGDLIVIVSTERTESTRWTVRVAAGKCPETDAGPIGPPARTKRREVRLVSPMTRASQAEKPDRLSRKSNIWNSASSRVGPRPRIASDDGANY